MIKVKEIIYHLKLRSVKNILTGGQNLINKHNREIKISI